MTYGNGEATVTSKTDLTAPLKDRYKALAVLRENFLWRARDVARLTIPSLLPYGSSFGVGRGYGGGGTTDLDEVYSSLGARVVTHLASKLMVAFMPPGYAFFKLGVPAKALVREGKLNLEPKTEQQLSLIESLIDAEVNRKQWREPTYTALQHLIVTGNILEQMLDDNTLKMFRLDQYCVVRTPAGRVIEIVIEEELSPYGLPEDVRAMLGSQKKEGENVFIYTCARWTQAKGKWHIYQEVEDKLIPGSDGFYEINPFNALRWTAVIGEDYGRSKCDEHRGDFMAIEGLSKAVLDGAAMASRNIILANPAVGNASVNRKALASARNGEILIGDPQGVAFLQFGNTAGMQVAAAELERISQQVAAAFLLQSGVTRDAERVTREEILRNAQELEGALGGVYSTLSHDMQAARLKRLIFQMQANDELPKWGDMIEPTIITGFEALGRASDVGRVQQALAMLQGLPPEVLAYVNWNAILGKVFNGLGLADSVKTEEEVNAMRQQQMAEQAAQQVAATAGEQAVTPQDIQSVT